MKMTKKEYDAMHERFEAAIKKWNASPTRGKFNLARLDVEIDGRAHVRYSDPDTDNAWIGFQLSEATRA